MLVMALPTHAQRTAFQEYREGAKDNAVQMGVTTDH